MTFPGPDAASIAARFGATLLALARDAIRHGLEQRAPPEVPVHAFDEELRAPLATFVTLTIDAQLRGCIGSLEATRPLVVDVALNAYASAFSDPRFPPLITRELRALAIHISLLSRPEALRFASETDLLRQLRPGVDGLILEEHGHRGTFLPSVWEQLSQPAAFLRQLKLKAGLPADYWSATLRVQRYTCVSIT